MGFAISSHQHFIFFNNINQLFIYTCSFSSFSSIYRYEITKLTLIFHPSTNFNLFKKKIKNMRNKINKI